jgi:hypothetical protein
MTLTPSTRLGWKRTIAIVPAGKQSQPTIRVVLDWPAMVVNR